jgi:2-polyprenyl-3-methyl-5-hydroxy-6-metoxy-1,4-benzoquinol methylase
MRPCSPLTGKTNTRLLKSFPSILIIDSYREHYKLDTFDYFKGVDKVELWECLDTGYVFYFPQVVGDATFYNHFKRFDWYYTADKWEHLVALDQITPDDKVLEIGCGQGAFIRKLIGRCADYFGIEMDSIVLEDKELAPHIVFEPIDKVPVNWNNYFTVICLFQVLEHIPNVGDFLKKTLALLRPGGKLIVSVPNNWPGSPIFIDNVLNMPPHHQGIWQNRPLAALTTLFPLGLHDIIIEPLQLCHKSIFTNFILRKIVPGKYAISRYARRAIRPFADRSVNYLAPFIVGHSVLAIYKKSDENIANQY